MRAIFFPVQSYQIRRQNRQRFRGVRLLTPNSFLNDRTAQTDRTKRKRTLPYGRHIESGRKGAKSSFRLKCRFTSSSDLALFAQDAGAKPLYCSSDSVPSNSSRMPRTTPARAAITIMALIRTTIHFVFCIGGGHSFLLNALSRYSRKSFPLFLFYIVPSAPLARERTMTGPCWSFCLSGCIHRWLPAIIRLGTLSCFFARTHFLVINMIFISIS